MSGSKPGQKVRVEIATNPMVRRGFVLVDVTLIAGARGATVMKTAKAVSRFTRIRTGMAKIARTDMINGNTVHPGWELAQMLA